MKPCLRLLALVLTGAACGTPAWSQTIYKCGTSYSQQSCPDSITVDVSDTRTQAQKAQTDAATASAGKIAAQMEKDRLAREKAQVARSPKKSALNPKTVKTVKTGSSSTSPKASTKKKKAPEYFTAEVAAEKKDKNASKKSVDKAQVAGADKTDRVVQP